MTQEVISFTKVRGPYGWLSNMSPHPVAFDIGSFPVTYRTCEHLFQCLRFAPADPVRNAIMAAASPMRAKQLAKHAISRATHEPRSEGDVINMRLVLLCKLHAHPHLRGELLATGDARLVEDVSSRSSVSGLFWGMAQRSDGWHGSNVLGDLWAELRGRLRSGELAFPVRGTG